MTPDTRVRYGIPGPKTVDEAKEEYNEIGADVIQGWLPQLDMPYLADTAPYYYDWLENEPYDAYWDWGNLEDKYGRVQAAVLNLSGWYDEAYGTQGATDLRWLADRSDVLTFETEPLPADIEVTGPITAEIWLSSSAPDCDIYTELLDVAPDGGGEGRTAALGRHQGEELGGDRGDDGPPVPVGPPGRCARPRGGDQAAEGARHRRGCPRKLQGGGERTRARRDLRGDHGGDDQRQASPGQDIAAD
jgi:hypothetical protein